MKLTIPSLDLRTPVYPSATVENLADGPAIIAGNIHVPVVAGYGSVDGAVFATVRDLAEGDRITVTMLMVGSPERADVSEITRTYAVVDVTETALQDLPPWNDTAYDSLVLVADGPDDPNSRVVVSTELISPDATSYGINPDD